MTTKRIQYTRVAKVIAALVANGRLSAAKAEYRACVTDGANTVKLAYALYRQDVPGRIADSLAE